MQRKIVIPMEEQSNEKKNSYKYVSLIIVAILACVFIGVRVYTRYLEKQNMELITKHIEEDPDFLYKRATSMGVEGKEEVTWSYYNCRFGCFQKPSNFDVEEEDVGQAHRVTCTAKGDILTMVQFSCTINPDFKLLDEDDKDTRYETAILDIKSSLRDNYSKISFKSVGDNEKRGNMYGRLVSFHAQISDLPDIDGEVFMSYRGDKLLLYISQYAEGGPIDDLETLIASLVVNK